MQYMCVMWLLVPKNMNIKGSLLWPGASQWRIYNHRMWGQLSTTCSNVLKQPNGELLVAVNHNQLRTMASETVDPTDWSHSPPSWAVPPERHVPSINQCNLSGTGTCNRSMRGNRLDYAATQGITFRMDKTEQVLVIFGFRKYILINLIVYMYLKLMCQDLPTNRPMFVYTFVTSQACERVFSFCYNSL